MDTTTQSHQIPNSRGLIFLGLVLSMGVAFWWNNELASILGDEIAKSSFHCLIKAGTGDCQQLWLVGFHQTNQFASLAFYGGVLAALYGCPDKVKIALLILVGIIIVSVSSETTQIQTPKAEQTQHTQFQAQQKLSNKMQQANEEANAAIMECRNKRLTGDLKTYVASVNCSNPRFTEAYQNAGYKYMDLIGLITAKRLEVAEKIDSGKLTEGEGQLANAEFLTHVMDIQNQRNASR